MTELMYDLPSHAAGLPDTCVEPCVADDVPVTALDIGSRVINALTANGIHCVRDIRALGPRRLSRLSGFGKRSAEIVMEAIGTEGRDAAAVPKPADGSPSPARIADDIEVTALPLSTRAHNALVGNGLLAVRDVRRIGVRGLRKLHGVGEMTVREIMCSIGEADAVLAGPAAVDTTPTATLGKAPDTALIDELRRRGYGVTLVLSNPG